MNFEKMSKQESLRQLATHAIAEGEAFFESARFQTTQESRIARLYTLSIFEQFHATLYILDSDVGTQSPCLIRAMLEYLVELLNILNQPGYCSQLVKENAYSDDKVIKNYLDALAAGEPDEALINEVSGLLAEIQAKDQKKEEQRSKKILNTGQHLFPALYALLCGMTHPNLTSVLARHREGRVKGPLRYRCPPHPAVYSMLLSIAILLLSITIRQLPLFTDRDRDEVSKFTDYLDSANFGR
jgi:hypothetical protein